MRRAGVDTSTWADHTDTRPTVLALAGLNLLLSHNLLSVTDRTPFYPPGWNTLISLVALAVFGAFAFIRRGRGGSPPSGPLPDDATPTQVPVGAENSQY